MNSTPSNSPVFVRWFRDNPWWGLGGALLGAAGIVLTIVMYYVNKRDRQLVYKIDPTRTTIVDSKDAPAQFKVLYGDRSISGDVTAAQITLWNRGYEPIKMDNVERPVMITLRPSHPVLECRISQTDRLDITQIKMDLSQAERGQIEMRWHVLEHNDGIVVQLVYAGSPDTDIQVRGTIEGQGDLGAQFQQTVNDWTIEGFGLLQLAALFVFMQRFGSYLVRRSGWGFTIITGALWIVLVLSGALAFSRWYGRPLPPSEVSRSANRLLRPPSVPAKPTVTGY